MNLKEIRNEIDNIDIQILNLILKRMQYSEEIAKIKEKENMPIVDKKREEEVLTRIIKEACKYKKQINKIFDLIIKTSREIQENICDNLK